MLVFYIQAKEDQISVDPLTKLNNRAQMFRYLSQDANMRREGRETYVVMIDINDFKEINDTYGHNNGDRALVTIADALRKAVGMSNMPGFIGRFGGDEFIMIMHPVAEEDMKKLEVNIRFCVHKDCVTSKLPFTITIGIGYDKLTFGNGDNFQSCLERADAKLYEDKARIKQEQAS
jgi:diguanylate cyclase (GGDEF)-like protein